MIGRAKILDRFIDRIAEKDKLTVVIQSDSEPNNKDLRPQKKGRIVWLRSIQQMQTLQKVCQDFQPGLIIVVTSPSNKNGESAIALLRDNNQVKMDSLSMVINSMTIESQIRQSPDVRRQIKEADVLLPVQTDLLDSIRIQHLVGSLRSLNPDAPILSLESDEANPTRLYGQNLLQKALSKQSVPFGCREKNNSDFDRLSCYRIDLKSATNRKQFLNHLSKLNTDLYRAEGIVDLNNNRLPQHFKYVRGKYEFFNYPDNTVTDRFVILISKEKNNYFETIFD